MLPVSLPLYLNFDGEFVYLDIHFLLIQIIVELLCKRVEISVMCLVFRVSCVFHFAANAELLVKILTVFNKATVFSSHFKNKEYYLYNYKIRGVFLQKLGLVFYSHPEQKRAENQTH